MDGSSNTDDPIVLKFNNDPNPFQDAMVMNFNLKESIFLKIGLTAVDGMFSTILFTGQAFAGDNHLVIDRNNIPSGSYILSLIGNKEVIKSTKVIIQ